MGAAASSTLELEKKQSLDDKRLDLILELRPRVVGFHFGLPQLVAGERIKKACCGILRSATTLAEARSLSAHLP